MLAMGQVEKIGSVSGRPARRADGQRHVFVSYRRSHGAAVDELLAALGDRYVLWRDTAKIRGGQRWREAITGALESAYAMILVVSPDIEHSKNVYAEWFYAQGIGLPVIPLQLPNASQPRWLEGDQARAWPDDVADLQEDLDHYARQAQPLAPISDEQAFLNALWFDYLQQISKYTPLAGEHRRQKTMRASLQPIAMHPEFSLRPGSPLLDKAVTPGEPTVHQYQDLLPVLHRSRRALVLGEPGSGKTTTLYKFADELRRAALADPTAPLPVIVPLRQWRAATPWAEFLAEHLGGLSDTSAQLLADHRLYLLLDGLNEIPRDNHREKKLDQLRRVVKQDDVRAIVTCRELDYTDAALKLDLDDTIVVHPMDPERILEFLTAYLVANTTQTKGRARAETLFWQIAGGERIEGLWQTWQLAGADLNLFFQAADIPRENPHVYDRTSSEEDLLWRRVVKSPTNLIHLAANPYLLWMFLNIYLDPRVGRVPDNRAALFDEFVFHLLRREQLTEGDGQYSDLGRALLDALGRLAWTLQSEAGASTGVELTLARDTALQVLGDEATLYRAASASILEDGESVRFTHQLLQEYFTARRLLEEIDNGLSADHLWPADRWWQPSGWEEAAVLATGVDAERARRVMEWLLPHQPEVAARCIQRSGIAFDDEQKHRLRDLWLPHLDDVHGYPQAQARAAIGRALGRIALQDGTPLDSRPGVGIDRRGLPDIAWSPPIGPGQVEIVNHATVKIEHAFEMAIYPVTNRQFEAFVIDPEGYANKLWWKKLQRSPAPHTPRWDEPNHPRESVSWHEAVAYCRWLSARLDMRIRLPTEAEWQLAAGGGYPDHEYPWSGPWDASYCNNNQSGIERTTVVGMYPQGVSPYGLLDMAGNVWEWCTSTFDNPKAMAASRGAERVIRSGSCFTGARVVRCASRSHCSLVSRLDYLGFRCARVQARKSK